MRVPDALIKIVELVPALKRASKLVLIPHSGAVHAQTPRVPAGNAGDVATVTVVLVLLRLVYLLRAIVRASRAQNLFVKTTVVVSPRKTVEWKC